MWEVLDLITSAARTGSHGPWDGLHMNHEKWPTKWRGLYGFIILKNLHPRDFGCSKFSIALGESTSRLQKVVTWVTWTNQNGDVRAIKWCREWKMEDLWVNQLVKGRFMWTHIWQIWWGPMSCAAKRIYIYMYVYTYIYIYYVHIYIYAYVYIYIELFMFAGAGHRELFFGSANWSQDFWNWLSQDFSTVRPTSERCKPWQKPHRIRMKWYPAW